MYIHVIYTLQVYMSTSVPYSYIKYNYVADTLTTEIYTVFSRNCVFDKHDDCRNITLVLNSNKIRSK
jgi:hypothetical protein